MNAHTEITSEVLEQAFDLGTVYPCPTIWSDFTSRRQEYADSVNGGRVGEILKVYDNSRGLKEFFAPELNAKWRHDFQ